VVWGQAGVCPPQGNEAGPQVIFMSFRGPKASNDKEERSSGGAWGRKRARAKERIAQANTNGLNGVREAAPLANPPRCMR
jgi:hypothetical protein